MTIYSRVLKLVSFWLDQDRNYFNIKRVIMDNSLTGVLQLCEVFHTL